MTSSINAVSARPFKPATGELIGALTEGVVLPPDPQARSAVTGGPLYEVCTAVEWLHGRERNLDNANGNDLISLRPPVAAVQDHQERIGSPGGDPVKCGSR